MDLDCTSFEKESRKSQLPQFIISRFQNFYKQGELCDYTIITSDNHKFHAHKVYLAAFSDHIYTMVNAPMVESHTSQVHLQDVSSEGLGPILDYAYGGKLNLDEVNMAAVLHAASHLQIGIVLKQWRAFVKSVVNIENCVQHLNLAELYSMDDAKHVVVKFILDNFAELVSEGYFLQLTFHQLLFCVRSSGLRCDNEMDVLQLIQSWIEWDEEERHNYATDLFENVRFALIERDILLDLNENKDYSLCWHFIKNALDYQNQPIHLKVLRQNDASRIRSTSSFVIVSTPMNAKDGQSIGFAILEEGRWCWLPRMQEVFSTPSIAVVNNYVVVCGGRRSARPDAQVLDTCRILNPLSLQWTDLSPMTRPRTDFPLVEYDKNLYAIGGLVNENAESTDVIERYSFETNTWEEVANLLCPLESAAACVLHQVVYIGGGCEAPFISSDSFYSYYPPDGTVSRKASMLEPHAVHTMTATVDKVFVMQIFSTQPKLEGYDPCTDQWSIFRSCNLPLQAIVVPYRENLYFVPAYVIQGQEEQDIPPDFMLDFSDIDDLPELEERYLRYNLQDDTCEEIDAMLKVAVEQSYNMTGCWLAFPRHLLTAAKAKREAMTKSDGIGSILDSVDVFQS